MVKDKKLCFPVKVNLFFREYLRIYNVSSVSGRLIELTVFDLFSDSLFMKHFLKVFIFSAAVQSVFGWELKKDSEGIRVYVQEKKVQPLMNAGRKQFTKARWKQFCA